MAAQGSWADFQRQWRAGSRAPWTLLVRQGQVPTTFSRQDEGLSLMVAGGDLSVEFMAKTASERLAAARNWSSEPRWLLLDRQAELFLEGQGLPTGHEIRAFLNSSGYTLAWDRQEAFLHEHPDHGEALDTRLLTCLRLVRNRFRLLVDQGKARMPNLGQRVSGKLLLDPSLSGSAADEMYKECADTLDRLLRVADWWRFDSMNLRLSLRSFDCGASPRMRDVLRRMREAALEEWKRNPHLALASGAFIGDDRRSELGSIWVLCEQILEEGRVSAIPSMSPSPGRTWPPNVWLFEACEHYEFSKEWEGQVAFLDKFPLDYPQAPISEKEWTEFLNHRELLSLKAAVAHGHLGRWDEVRACLQEARRWSGALWGKQHLKGFFADPRNLKDGKDPNAILPRPVPPQDVYDLFDSPPLPSIPAPAPPPPIRMVLRGKPAWAADWEALKTSPELAPWGPGELKWGVASPEDEALLSRAGQGPFEWAALREGTGVLAFGQEKPIPGVLATQLAGGGLSRLQRLGKFLREHPDHLDARRDRIQLLLRRMPHPALEPLLAEDAAVAMVALAFEVAPSWNPNLQVWQPRAMRVVPELEAALQRWPSSASLWQAWIGWSVWLPRVPTVLGLAERLPVFGDRIDWRGRLPQVVHEAVAREYRKLGQFEPMRAWFQEAWDGARTNLVGELSGEDRARMEFIYQSLSEALTALKQIEPLGRLMGQWREITRKRRR